MKHNWEPVTQTATTFLSGPQRKCTNCGAEQTRESKHIWMRVVGYRWCPLAGRCKPKQ